MVNFLYKLPSQLLHTFVVYLYPGYAFPKSLFCIVITGLSTTNGFTSNNSIKVLLYIHIYTYIFVLSNP